MCKMGKLNLNTTLPELLLKHLADHFTCLLRNQTQQNNNQTALDELAKNQDAFIYIIAVLGFYSFGVIIMMIKFLQRERIDLQEEEVLEKFLEGLKKSRQLPKPQRRSSIKIAKARLAHARASLPCISFNNVHLARLSKKRGSFAPGQSSLRRSGSQKEGKIKSLDPDQVTETPDETAGEIL